MIQLQGVSQIMTGDETITLTRQSRTLGSGIVYVGGEATVDASQTSSYELACNVQPVPQENLQQLPEGQQVEDSFFLFAQNQPIYPQVGDTFTRDGVLYQVQEATFWGNYSRALAVNSQMLAEYDAAQNDGYDS